jgi:Hydantoinase/oxoprolinase N-terminal region
MSWSIGLHLGESTVEIVAHNNQADSPQLLKSRTFMAQGAQETAVAQFLANNNITEVSDVRILSGLPLKFIDSALGSAPAVLTTSGFESYLELSQPLKTKHFTSRPERAPLLIDSEYVFGVSERTNAQGHIEKLASDEELEFLVAKLELHEIKNIAVCFLHSNKNNENEKRVKTYFESRGFKVFKSSASGQGDEKERFWAAIYNAYVAPLFIEKMTAISAELQKVQTADATVTLGPYNLSDVISGQVTPLQTSFSFTNYIAEKFAMTSSLVYCGFEELLFFEDHGAQKNSWQDSTKTFSANHFAFTKPKLQPLTQLGRGFFSELTFLSKKISFDPGPVVFGRGLMPSLLDILTFDQDLTSVSGFKEKINDRGRTRLNESLRAYARNLSDSSTLSAEALAKTLLQMAANSWGSVY